jgi:hypothetical protein
VLNSCWKCGGALEVDKFNSGDTIPISRATQPILYVRLNTVLLYLTGSVGDGIDGLWSSFALRVGTPAQDVRVFASTNSPETLVVLPLGCTAAAINPVPNGCAGSRGGLFNPNTSSTWLDQGRYNINGDGVGFEANLGYSQPSDYGLESLGLGFVAGGANNPILKNQTVAAFATASPFYL